MMQIERRKAVRFINALTVFSEKAPRLPVKFGYGIARNKKALEPEISAIQEVQNGLMPTEKYIEYLNEVEKITSSTDTKLDKEAMIYGLRQLYQDEIKKHEERVIEFRLFLDEKFDFEPCRIRLSDFPPDLDFDLMDSMCECGMIEDG